jgi:hypothetical protein
MKSESLVIKSQSRQDFKVSRVKGAALKAGVSLDDKDIEVVMRNLDYDDDSTLGNYSTGYLDAYMACLV